MIRASTVDLCNIEWHFIADFFHGWAPLVPAYRDNLRYATNDLYFFLLRWIDLQTYKLEGKFL